ncbi:hypothetical protein PtA15_5A761 [Puccinia triticina]|uniref:Uncharacterized protein n=1 Tax=Puccinia triticina TaxID=208348 RepID=A0ABY7CMI6_9BASI|nr:uncharacterized protein PtA15_5A761 [Puccinia triticina]WAQ85187.1 hypothetical protein PtA15_5A761 [Puccinia triticina]
MRFLDVRAGCVRRRFAGWWMSGRMRATGERANMRLLVDAFHQGMGGSGGSLKGPLRESPKGRASPFLPTDEELSLAGSVGASKAHKASL